MPYANLTFPHFSSEGVHVPEWCRRSEVRRILSLVISIIMVVDVDV
ncbi:hypothetical protein Hanom_Chr04g00362491 [Helianthus anomalus]